jgi:hypothetical protein
MYNSNFLHIRVKGETLTFMSAHERERELYTPNGESYEKKLNAFVCLLVCAGSKVKSIKIFPDHITVESPTNQARGSKELTNQVRGSMKLTNQFAETIKRTNQNAGTIKLPSQEQRSKELTNQNTGPLELTNQIREPKKVYYKLPMSTNPNARLDFPSDMRRLVVSGDPEVRR